MKILTLRTDNLTAEVGIYNGIEKQKYVTWQAHTKLTKTLNLKISQVLTQANLSADELNGIIFYNGSGSFTGLRIGASVANTLAYSYALPIISASGLGWQKKGIKKIQAGENHKIVIPNYGSAPKTTAQRK